MRDLIANAKDCLPPVREAPQRPAHPDDVVELNVGGKCFATTFETLRKIPVLSEWTKQYPSPMPMIDRDPKTFRLLLNLARQRTSLPPDLTRTPLHQLRRRRTSSAAIGSLK